MPLPVCCARSLLASTEAAPAGVNGLLYGGGTEQLGKQAIGAGAVLLYSFIATLVIALLIKVTIGLRISEDEEISGIDLAQHAESAYVLGESGGGGIFAGVGHAARVKTEELS